MSEEEHDALPVTNGVVKEMVRAIRRISYGDLQPTGLEMLSIALAGERLGTPVSQSLCQIAAALEKIAEAIELIGADEPGRAR